jgi:hypothetical protein
MKATSWDDAKTILPDQVLEVRSIDGRLRFARKGREPDAGDQPKKAFDPEEFYGSDNGPEERHACQDGDTRVSDTVTGGDNVSREAHVYVCPAGKLLTSAWSRARHADCCNAAIRSLSEQQRKPGTVAEMSLLTRSGH